MTENAFAVNVVEDKTVVVDLKGPKLNDFVRDTMSFVGACHWTRGGRSRSRSMYRFPFAQYTFLTVPGILNHPSIFAVPLVYISFGTRTRACPTTK